MGSLQKAMRGCGVDSDPSRCRRLLDGRLPARSEGQALLWCLRSERKAQVDPRARARVVETSATANAQKSETTAQSRGAAALAEFESRVAKKDGCLCQ